MTGYEKGIYTDERFVRHEYRRAEDVLRPTPTPKPENEVKNVVFRCDVVKDKDILDALKDVKHKSDYIKSLLRRALQEENAEKERTEKEELSCAAESAAQEAATE